MFSKDEWIDVLIRSVGLSQLQFELEGRDGLSSRRRQPLVENNYNMWNWGTARDG